MNFITFPASATNVFPMANTTTGGQLATEFNLKSRESVVTDPEITYSVGPSYVHSEADFEVSILSDNGGAILNNYTLNIAPGRGVINGHYVETLVPMTIDLVEANTTLGSQSRPLLKGELAIGIRTFFATDQTVAGSILVENGDDMFLGVQLVVLPAREMITPEESPEDQSKVTADLRLATFTFLNNKISVLRNLKEKIQYISAERVKKLTDIVSEKYVSKVGLNSKKLYAFAGKGVNPATGADTWEDVTDSMVVWDATPERVPTKPPYKEAQFVTGDNSAYLVLPHKQVIGMTDDEGNDEYYAPKIMEVPVADYSRNTTGLVSKSYTKQIKRLAAEMSDFRSFVHGKQIYFMDTRTVDDVLPGINDAWNDGDYILVKNDEHFIDGASDVSSAPATMYVVLPGAVQNIGFVGQVDGDANTEPPVPSNIHGVELSIQEWYQSEGQDRPDTEYPDHYPEFFGQDDVVRGVPKDENTWYDYFKIRYYLEDSPAYAFTDYYYGVLTTGPRAWSDAVVVTGQVSFATEDVIGGFLNASEDATDYGYVTLDETGHLRLIDYNLLRSGTLAYQIATNVTIPSTSDYSEIQDYLTEYVNNRIAFPSSLTHSIYSNVLHIYLTLPETEDNVSLEVSGIDSRFNTAVCLHIKGAATPNVTVNIVDCEKFIIDPTIEGTPTINIFRTCLYYNPLVMQYIKTCERSTAQYGTFTGFQDLKLWYEKLSDEDAALVVDGMTVSELDAPIITSEIDYWRELGSAINDNNYLVALKSITFSGEGEVVGCEVLAANNSTDNIAPGNKIIVGEFSLPQGTSLIYPSACMTRVLKVTGEFTSAYYSDGNWYVTDNSFTLATGTYNPGDGLDPMVGTVAFHSVTTLVPSTISQTSINVWEPDSYHVFRGGAIT